MILVKKVAYRARFPRIGINALDLVVDVVISLEITCASGHDVDVHVLHSLACVLAVLNHISECSNVNVLLDRCANAVDGKESVLESMLKYALFWASKAATYRCELTHRSVISSVVKSA